MVLDPIRQDLVRTQDQDHDHVQVAEVDPNQEIDTTNNAITEKITIDQSIAIIIDAVELGVAVVVEAERETEIVANILKQ